VGGAFVFKEINNSFSTPVFLAMIGTLVIRTRAILNVMVEFGKTFGLVVTTGIILVLRLCR
jgi:hypothetical protein